MHVKACLLPTGLHACSSHPEIFSLCRRAAEVNAEAEAAVAAAEAAALDPDALKDALVEQARAQRHALLEASRRAGTGRVPRRREFFITLPPLPTEEELAAEEEAETAAEAAAAAAEEAAAADLQARLQGQEAGTQRWEELSAEAGVLAEHAAAACKPRLANAGSPGAALCSPSLQLEQGGSCEAAPGSVATAAVQQEEEALEPGTSQRGQARTPGTPQYGRYTPIEGVPERLPLLATRGKAAPAAATASLLGRPAATPAGFTPLEGIPERLLSFPALPGASRMGSNGRRPSVDSPVEGLVMEGAAHRHASAGAAPAQLACAGGGPGFDGFEPSPQFTGVPAAAAHAPSPAALPAPAALLQQQAAQQALQQAPGDAAVAGDVVDGDEYGGDFDDDDDMGGGFDDGGYHEGGELLRRL